MKSTILVKVIYTLLALCLSLSDWSLSVDYNSLTEDLSLICLLFLELGNTVVDLKETCLPEKNHTGSKFRYKERTENGSHVSEIS